MSGAPHKHWMCVGTAYKWRINQSAGMLFWREVDDEKYHPLNYIPVTRNYNHVVFPVVFKADIQGINGLVVEHTLLVKLEGLWTHKMQDLMRGYYVRVMARNGKPVLEFTDDMPWSTAEGFSPLTVVEVERLAVDSKGDLTVAGG